MIVTGKRIDIRIKNKIRREYELGIDLIELAIKYKVNYGTLKNIASKKEWKKNRIVDLVYLKEIERLSDELIEKRESKKQEYQVMTQEILNDLKTLEKLNDKDYIIDEDTTKSFAESKASALKIRASTLKELYSLDKELHNILNPDEEINLRTKAVKYLELKERILNSNNFKNKSDEKEDLIID